MKFQYMLFNLSITESYRRNFSVKAALTVGVNILRKVTCIIFLHVHW